jgi:hypothetical protein
LCEHLSIVARDQGFRVYPETGDFDLLLVAGEETNGFESGTQIGVQAKLRDNVEVLAQALPRMDRHPSQPMPHRYAVLVPRARREFRWLAARLSISVIEGRLLDNRYHSDLSFMTYHRYQVQKPCWEPTVEIPALQGGLPSVKPMTPWKLGAVGLCLLAEERGYITPEDFRSAAVSRSTFLQREWITRGQAVTVDGKKEYRYCLNADSRPPHLLFPEVAAALRLRRSA